MGYIKFLHTADLHIDTPFKGLTSLPKPLFERIRNSTFDAFDQLVHHAIIQKVDFVIIAGDLYDTTNRSVLAQTKLRKGFERLAANDISVVIIHGNHDHLGGDWLSIAWPKNVQFINSKNVEMVPFTLDDNTTVHLYGFSYHSRAVLDNKTSEYTKLGQADFHVGILHGALEGNNEHDHYAPFTIQQLRQTGFDYWALGHIHKKQILHTNPYILYPGNIQGLHRGETGDKGCYLVEMNNKATQLTFLPTAPIRWEHAEVKVEPQTTFDELLVLLENEKEKWRKETQSIMLQLVVTGNGTLYEELQDINVIDDLLAYLREGELRQKCFVWVEQVAIKVTSPVNKEELLQEEGFVGELLRQINSESSTNLKEPIRSLIDNPKYKRLIEPFNDMELEEILQDAEQLLLYQLTNEE